MVHLTISVTLDAVKECNYHEVAMQIQPGERRTFSDWKGTDTVIHKTCPNYSSFLSSTYMVSSKLALNETAKTNLSARESPSPFMPQRKSLSARGLIADGTRRQERFPRKGAGHSSKRR